MFKQFQLPGILAVGTFAATYFVVVTRAHRDAQSEIGALLTASEADPADRLLHSGPEPAPLDMAWIPGGDFQMGSNSPAARSDEQPAHSVRVSGFWIDATEVTNRSFREFVEATGYVAARGLVDSVPTHSAADVST